MILRDTYGDGICCYYGDGELEVEDVNGGLLAYSDGLYGTRDVMRFCVGPNFKDISLRTANERDAKDLTLPKKARKSENSIR